jgi:hypothetical protein
MIPNEELVLMPITEVQVGDVTMLGDTIIAAPFRPHRGFGSWYVGEQWCYFVLSKGRAFRQLTPLDAIYVRDRNLISGEIVRPQLPPAC